MNTLKNQLSLLIKECLERPSSQQIAFINRGLASLLAQYSLNPTGDDPASADFTEASLAMVIADQEGEVTPALQAELSDFLASITLLRQSQELLSLSARQALSKILQEMSNSDFLHKQLKEKFKTPANRAFLDKALHNTETIWQMAMVANWVLSTEGLKAFELSTWQQFYPALSLFTLIEKLKQKLNFEHIPSLRAYRKDAMHHYPRVSDDEFHTLTTEQWQDVINLPSGRKPFQDIPLITPFIKQGDIEHSLYRHFLMPDLLNFMRKASPDVSSKFDLQNSDRNILFSLPIVIQQIESDLFSHIKKTISKQIINWEEQCRTGTPGKVSDALNIIFTLWDYKRTPAANECKNPIDNLTKGFSATIQNAFSHLNDINFAASNGSKLDPCDVSEKFVLFASVSNGQLDNLGTAHQRYIKQLPNPADWNNESFFQHFLDVNSKTDLHHIQAHFLIDKTRGCPAIPQITTFHAIVLDLVLEYTLKEFGEENLRKAGDWYLAEKVPD